jgi:hypothetical protein
MIEGTPEARLEAILKRFGELFPGVVGRYDSGPLPEFRYLNHIESILGAQCEPRVGTRWVSPDKFDAALCEVVDRLLDAIIAEAKRKAGVE